MQTTARTCGKRKFVDWGGFPADWRSARILATAVERSACHMYDFWSGSEAVPFAKGTEIMSRLAYSAELAGQRSRPLREGD